MATNKEVQQWADWIDEPLITFDGLDDAIIGVSRTHTQPTRVAYSFAKVLTILINGGMSYEEALEYFSFNIEVLWAGENTPTIIYDLEEFI